MTRFCSVISFISGNIKSIKGTLTVLGKIDRTDFEITAYFRQKHFEIRADFQRKNFEIRVLTMLFNRLWLQNIR